MYDFGGSLSSQCDTLLLGRLSTELASIYRDTLQSPLPPRLQTLIDRLETAGLGSHDPNSDD